MNIGILFIVIVFIIILFIAIYCGVIYSHKVIYGGSDFNGGNQNILTNPHAKAVYDMTLPYLDMHGISHIEKYLSAIYPDITADEGRRNADEARRNADEANREVNKKDTQSTREKYASLLNRIAEKESAIKSPADLIAITNIRFTRFMDPKSVSKVISVELPQTEKETADNLRDLQWRLREIIGDKVTLSPEMVKTIIRHIHTYKYEIKKGKKPQVIVSIDWVGAAPIIQCAANSLSSDKVQKSVAEILNLDLMSLRARDKYAVDSFIDRTTPVINAINLARSGISGFPEANKVYREATAKGLDATLVPSGLLSNTILLDLERARNNSIHNDTIHEYTQKLKDTEYAAQLQNREFMDEINRLKAERKENEEKIKQNTQVQPALSITSEKPVDYNQPPNYYSLTPAYVN